MMNFFWRRFGSSIAPSASLGFGAIFGKRNALTVEENVSIGVAYHIAIGEKGSLRIGRGTKINRFFTCGVNDMVSIGEDCLFSYNVSIQSSDHHFSREGIPGDGPDVARPITIGNRCFFGCGSVILKGVTLGDNCVVGANAVVTSSFPSGSVIVGNPAKCIKTL